MPAAGKDRRLHARALTPSPRSPASAFILQHAGERVHAAANGFGADGGESEDQPRDFQGFERAPAEQRYVDAALPRGLINRLFVEALRPRARRIALATVGVPPLFTLAGVVLDGLRTRPVRGLGMWMLVWSGLTLVALLERPRDPLPIEHARPERLAMAHGVVALPVILFTIAHLFNHVLGIVSGELHIVVMDAMRQVYRMPAVEIALMACIAFQVVAGLWLTRAKLRRVAALADTVQIAAGVYLTCFFASHLTATFRARLLRNVDTNWTWLTGANLLTDAWSARLTPYYFLAVVAVGVHVACGLRYVMLGHGAAERVADRVSYGLMAVAVAASAVIMTGLVRASL